MLNKIKDKFINILRKNCGYYVIKLEYDSYRKYITKCITELAQKEQENMLINDKISSQYETKTLEYDILKHQFNNLVDMMTNESVMPEIVDLEYITKCYEYEKQKDYKKYLVAELEEILKIMKEKGIHPQDLIKRIINKANRDLK